LYTGTWRDDKLRSSLDFQQPGCVSFLRLVIALLTLACGGMAVQAVEDLGTRDHGADWPTFLGPHGDNTSTETGLQLVWPASGPRLVWSYPLGDSYGINSVSRGRCYQFDHRQGQAVLLCLNSETGKLIWQFAYPSDYVDFYNYSSGPRTTPVVDDERVYIYGVEGLLHCLSATDGSLLWKIDTKEKFGVVQNFFGVGSTPVIYRDLLLTMVGGSPAEDQRFGPGQLDRVRGNGSGVVAFDKMSGEVRYQFSDELASYASPRVVQGKGRDWCFMFMRGGLLVFDPATGKQDFHFPWRAKTLESVNASAPVVWDQQVLISETYGPGTAVLRFQPNRYELVWSDAERRRDKSMQTHWNTPIYREGYIYGSSGRHTQNAELRCIEAASGRIKWSEPGLTRCNLLYVDRHFICLSEYGTLRVVKASADRYELVSEFTPLEADAAAAGQTIPLLKYPAWAAPALSHGRLYVRGKDRLLCYDLLPDQAAAK
jgi:outer membrane protein assembly factor BamB